MLLSEAISAVEQADTARVAAHNQTVTDQAAADAQQAKADAAKNVVGNDQTSEAAANAVEVTALQAMQSTVADLIAALTPPAPPAA